MRLALAALLLSTTAPLAAAPAKPAPPRPAPAAPVKPLAYTERVLANGLRVYAVRDTSTANVSVHVWYDVGSKDDPRDRSGFAHLFEHLMFKATRNLPAETFDRLTEDVGGFNNASTADDYTNYFETVPANHLERILFAEAERMSSLVVEPAGFASERDVVKEEFRQRVLASPYGRLFYLYLPEISYARHPYARPGIGSLANLEAASIDDVRAFHATYYRPDNAVLVVAGNFDPAQLDRWIDRYFAPLKRPDRPIPRVTVSEPPRTAAVARTVYADNLPLPAVMLSYQLPPDHHPDTPALAMLSAILATGDGSRLYQSLVYRDQVAAQIGAFAESKQGTGTFAVFAILAGGKTVAAGEAALKREIARLRQAPVTAAELARARNQLLTQAIQARETPDGKASALAEAVLVDGDPRAADAQLAALARVTAADVQRVARRYLGDQQVSSLRYLPRTPGGPAGDAIDVPTGVSVAALTAPAGIEIVTPAPEGERRPLPAPAPARPVLVPPVHEAKLANGLRVVTIERHDLPLVSMVLAMPGAGSAADPKEATGVNAFAAGLLTKGTATRSASRIAEEIEALGGSISSDADHDGATVGVSVQAGQADKAAAILADVAQHPALAPAELERARAQRLDALQVALNDPGALAALVVPRAVFGDAPYGRVAEGTPASVKTLTIAQVRQAYAAGWDAGRATLIFAGDITPARARALAQANFGNWKARGRADSTPPAAVAPPAPRVIVIDIPGAGQASVYVARPGIARSDAGYPAAAVANAVLGGGYSARLNLEIRVRRGLSYGAGSRFDARRGVGPLTASAQTKNATAPEVAALIIAAMKQLGTEPVPAAELTARKDSLIGQFAQTTELVNGLAGLASGYVIDGLPIAEMARYPQSVQAITPDAVRESAARLLDPQAASIVIAGDAAQFAEDLRKTYPQLEVISAKQLNLDRVTLK